LRLDTRSRDELIRKRHAAGERISDLAREFGITPQRVHQIVNDKQK
jgi:transposase-like protein